MQPRQRNPLHDVSHAARNTNSGLNKAPVRYKKSKPFTTTDDNLSNPFKAALTIKSNASSVDASEDDDIKKPLNFHSVAMKSSSPERHIQQTSSSTSSASLMPTPQRRERRPSNVSIPATPTAKSGSFSISPSPGVICSKQNIASPQRVPSISLRSFHTTNHIEFYKPIPINQCRSTQFQILNETYDDKAIQLRTVTKGNNFNDISCITIAPTAVDLKRNQSCLITVSCRPLYAMRIKEVINIEWDLHSIQLHIHAVGFRKSMRTNGQKRQRKRTLKNMRKEDEDTCNSVESSMRSSGNSSSCNSIPNSARKGKRRGRRPMLSPTIRREKTFTAAPFSSPAPFKLRNKFMFNDNKNVYDGLDVVNEENIHKKQISFTPKEFKKRRVIEPEQRCTEREQFERLCSAVQPLQALFRCYLAQKRMDQILRQKQQEYERQQYYANIIRSQLIMKRVHNKYMNYRHAVGVLQCAFRTYGCYKHCKQYREHLAEQERQRIHHMKQQYSACVIQSWFKSAMCRTLYIQHVEQIKMERERQRIQRIQTNAAVYIQKWFRGTVYCAAYRKYQMEQRRLALERQRQKENSAATYIQSWTKGVVCRRIYRELLHQKKEEERQRKIAESAAIFIQTWIRTTLHQRAYRQYLAQKREEERILQIKMNNAAIYIQSWMRSILYQRRYRRHLAQKREEERILQIKMNNAAIYIQSWFRTMSYQRAYRRYLAQKREEERIQRIKMNNAAIYIQSWFRTTLYQRRYQQYLAQKREKERIQRIKRHNASIYIQSWFRTMLRQRRYRRYLEQKREEERQRIAKRAAIYIQSWLRTMLHQRGYLRYLAQKREEERILRIKMHNATIYIQSWFRTTLYQRSYQQYLAQKREKERIQRIKIYNASIYIQSWMRTMLYRRGYIQYLAQKREEERIQRIKMNNAAMYIQSWLRTMLYQRGYRQYLAQKREEERIQRMKMNHAAIYIQSWLRTMLYQRGYRQYLVQKREEEARIQRIKMNHAAIYIQSWFRTMLFQRSYQQYLQQKREEERQRRQRIAHSAASYIQSWFRTMLFQRGYRQYLQQKREEERQRRQRIAHSAATYIQSWFKGIMYRRNYQTHLWHKKQEELRLLREKQQQYMCCMRACKRTRMEYLRIKQSCVVLQGVFRSYGMRKKYRNIRNTTVFIQCFIRGKLWRYQYLNILQEIELQKQREKRQAVLGVLSLWRLHKFHKIIQVKHRQLVMYHGASTFIQSWFRGIMFERAYRAHLKHKREEERIRMEQMRLEYAANFIQSWFRTMFYQRRYRQYVVQKREKERQRMQQIKMENAAIYIQSWFKGVMFRIMYREHTRLQNDDYQQQVIRMQALMRGKLTRLKCCRNKELLRLLKNVNKAHKHWEKKKTVNYLLDDAVNKLVKSRTLYGVSEACDTLETLLKVVPNVSCRIIEHNIIGALYNVLRNSNRSEPHLYLVRKILHFMLFFAQQDVKSYEAIFYRDDTLDILSERLQIHRLDFVLFELTTQLFFVGVDVEIPFKDNKFLIDLRKSDVNRQIRTVQKIMCSKLEIAKRVNRPLRKLNNAKVKYKMKFQQEKTLAQCVQNMNKLVDKL